MADRLARFGDQRPGRGGFNSKPAEPQGGGALFIWTIFIILLVGFAAFCWMGSIYIFGHPEEAFSYSILHKLKKLDPPKRFSETAAPKGEFLDAKALLAKYGPMSPHDLRKESDALLRNYIRNYKQNPTLVPYVVGKFNILDSVQLGAGDFFQSGVVAITQSSDDPSVLVEHVFPADERMIPTLHRSLLTGLDIPLRRSLDLSAVVNIGKLDDGRIKFTVVPIQYPGYAASQGPGGFALEPPATLNVEAGLPVLTSGKIADAEARYASYRRKVGLDTKTPGSESAAAAPSNELVRVQPATALNGAEPAPPAVARAIPVDAVPPAPAAAATPGAVVGIATPEPEVRAALPVTPTATAPAVPLKPFAGGQSAAVASTSSGKWEMYAAGKMPRGRLVSVTETPKLAGTESTGERLYLSGDFVVTATGPSGAVLRPRSGAGGQNVRVIVQFPAGTRPPDETAGITRGSDRPFLITDVTEGGGQINVFAREITQ